MNVFRTGSWAVCARTEICRKVSQILYLSAQVRMLLFLLLQRGERRSVNEVACLLKSLIATNYCVFFVSFSPN